MHSEENHTEVLKLKRKAIYKIVENIIKEELFRDNIKKTDTLSELGADSLDVIVIIEKVERHFGIEISDEEIKEIATIRDLVDCIEHQHEQ